MSTFLSELQNYPSMFSVRPGAFELMTAMSENADAYGVYAHLLENHYSFKMEYDEHTLFKVKTKIGESMGWARFFETVRDVFNGGSIEVRVVEKGTTASTLARNAYSAGNADNSHSEQLEVTCVSKKDRKKVIFTLPRVDDDMQHFIVDRMVRIQMIYAHPREFQQQLNRVRSEEQMVRTQTDSLEREALSLKENLARNKQQETNAKRRLKELEKKLAPTHNDKADDPWENLVSKNLMASQSTRRVNPLGDRTCKDFDMTLLRLIKSRYVSYEEYDPTSAADHVVQSFTPAERAKQIQHFSSPKREVVWRAMDKLSEWDYNVFAIHEAMEGSEDQGFVWPLPHGGSLAITLYALLCKNRILHKFNIDEQIALNWISAVESGYHRNPYHNSIHAADVLHITHFILSEGGLAKKCQLSDEQFFAALIAAAIHDFDHPGINNNFLVKTQSYLATLYNDRSVLENIHVSSVFELMKNPAFDILASFSDAQRKEIRDTVIEMVLATDMSLHGKYVARIKSRVQEQSNFQNKEDQLLALSIALKMADISNCARPLDIYLKWGGRVSDEFYLQGDRERNLGLPCSPFMDRFNPSLARGQISFITYIIIPFFDQAADFLPDMRFAVELAEGNKAYWEAHDDTPK